ncbi:ATP-dependent translocase ABCB1 isoform X1 [Lepeophtheirus salmonis]|uniref:ATP-dependent translocase ABCB1 isoform X1 n=1 Tax=Lepeophtheirus salmonis TaxID=72036 RepID=UPI001AE5B03B|nr:ATP-dependent translocase ABCB1-like isoform X1 [Lepeophtheirus salmonis]
MRWNKYIVTPEKERKKMPDVSHMNGIINSGFEEIELNDNNSVLNPEEEKKNGETVEHKSSVVSNDNLKLDINEDISNTHVPFMKLFSYATRSDLIFIGIGILAALIGGLSLPFMIMLFGELTDTFILSNPLSSDICLIENGTCCSNNGTVDLSLEDCDLNEDDITQLFKPINFLDGVARFGQGTAIIGLINFITSYIFVTSLNFTAERQVHRIRKAFFKSLLNQDIKWFDTHETGDFATKITEDLNKLQEGIGEKIGLFIFFITIFISSLITAFIHGWELTLVILSAMPILMIAVGIIAKSQTALTVKESNAYSKAGSVAEEAFSSIKTVMSFQGQNTEIQRYKENLSEAQKTGILRGLLTGIGGGLMWFIIYSSYAIAFWYGVKLILDDRESCIASPTDCQIRYGPSNLLIVFFSVLMGAMNIGQASPYVEAFAIARGAASSVFQIIQSTPAIKSDYDHLQRQQDKAPPFTGRITFKNVHFEYPSRPTVKVLSGLSFEASPGKTLALVGPSGCGKSTVIQLIQRFYDPSFGVVSIDGEDITTLDPHWLRSHIGIVGQEPVLFEYSIKENITMGLQGEISEKMIDDTCKAANAYDFIQRLPKKYDTIVGEKGALLSGGQKQRIAIARALIRNPSILLLDEASSALDSQSEFIVQSALDKARKGRTTIIVAHRLSTIRSADAILVMKDGYRVDYGTHESLKSNKTGLYCSLVNAQDCQVDQDEGLPLFNPELNYEEEDEVYDLEQVENEMNSMTYGSISGGSSWNRRHHFVRPTLERRHSTGSGYSEDSLKIEDALDVAGSAIGIARVGSRKIRRTSTNFTDNEYLEAEEMKSVNSNVGFFTVLRENSNEWLYIFMGCIASVVMGASMPVYAHLFGEVLGVLSKSIEEARVNSITYSMYFLLVGIIVGFSMFMQIFMFSLSGELLTTKLRIKAFTAMLNQEVGWYDESVNSTGALCSRLSADASAVQGATGSRLGTIIQVTLTILMSISAALYFNIKLGLVGTLFVPFVLIGAWFQGKIITSQDNLEKDALSRSARIAIEAINGIRTVVGLRLEESFQEKYSTELKDPHESAIKNSHLRGLIFGFSQSIPFFAYAGTMYYGGTLVESDGLPYKNVFKVAETLILGTLMVGQATAFGPNYTKARIASIRIFKLLNREPKIRSDVIPNTDEMATNMNGEVTFTNAGFYYPTRKSVKVLRDLKLSIKSGQSIGIVGSSGCGKSTIIQLIQKFYDLSSGKLELDSKDSESINVMWLRSKIGIVSQEPNLFNRSIRENICYGLNKRNDVSMDDIIQAAKDANIHSFIASLPQGYDTRVGNAGTMLSGGQKQRIAIARALIRNPSLLLLDEATSALDTESEKVVQEALNKALENRTSITIAHRLSTIKNVDKIFVLNQGKVAEAGSHESLLLLKGFYYKLWTNGTQRKI